MITKQNIIILFLITMQLVVYSQDNYSILSNTPLTEKDKVTEKKKKFIQSYFQAEKHKLLEEYQDALIQYEKCIFLIPEESAPYYQIAKLYLYIFQEIDNAEYYIKEAINTNPKNKWYYYDLLGIYAAKSDIKNQKSSISFINQTNDRN